MNMADLSNIKLRYELLNDSNVPHELYNHILESDATPKSKLFEHFSVSTTISSHTLGHVQRSFMHFHRRAPVSLGARRQRHLAAHFKWVFPNLQRLRLNALIETASEHPPGSILLSENVLDRGVNSGVAAGQTPAIIQRLSVGDQRNALKITAILRQITLDDLNKVPAPLKKLTPSVTSSDGWWSYDKHGSEYP